MPSQYSDSLLRAEIQSDPAKIGYAGKSPAQVAAMLNAPAYTAYQPASMAAVLKWGGATGVRLNVELAATKAAPFTAISASNQGLALAIRDMLQGGYGSLDVSDPAIVGAVSGGAAYTPGATVATPGMLDALVSAAVMTAAQKDSLIELGQYQASRVQVLFGATAPTIDADRVANALRS